ncbi:MAG: A/G-specific adenine glycosylase [Erysipelotrichaceae bacterium]|jgi:A/G-specific adenine glycosylase|nr:A/G-specific adenine glycosylase [Erysipelotrichaceae bacterium]
MKVKAIVCDLDNTLLNDKKRLSPNSHYALRQALNHGIAVIVASARSYGEVKKFLPQDIFRQIHFCLLNGTWVRVIGKKPVPFTLSLKQSKKVVEILWPLDIAFHYEIGDEVFANPLDYQLHLERKKLFPKRDQRRFHLCTKADCLKLRAGKIQCRSVEHYDSLKEKLKGLMQVFIVDGGRSLSLIPTNADKGKGVSYLLKQLDILEVEAIVFGDDNNDLPMFLDGFYKVAMGNAVAALKEAADAVCEDYMHDGIYHELVRMKAIEPNPMYALWQNLEPWYQQNRRALPFRSDPTPYHIWVSEIMLQQTRVSAVLPFYQRFLESLPDIQSLAEADLALLYKLWEGLGYYSRVINMQKSAKLLEQYHQGTLPDEYDDLICLPGIGDYTACAILSIAFNKPAVCVDGNIARVMARVLKEELPIQDKSTKDYFKEQLALALPEMKPGDFNQALMELGALICLPGGQPLCTKCPLAKLCLAYQQKTQSDYPTKKKEKKKPEEWLSVVILSCRDRYYLEKRENPGVLHGLYQWCNYPGRLTQKELKEKLEADGFSVLGIKNAGVVRHVFTHKIWMIEVYYSECAENGSHRGGAWSTREEIREYYALPTAFMRCWDLSE